MADTDSKTPPAPAKGRLLLSRPAFRRWITPDVREAVVKMEGFTPDDPAPFVLRVASTDLDTDKTEQHSLDLQPGQRTVVVPSPRFHAVGEIVAVLEDRKGNALAEARWRVTGMAAPLPPRWFDGRPVAMIDDQAAAPRLHRAADATADDLLKRLPEIAKAGFSIVVAPSVADDVSLEKTAALVE
ncbi:MAG: hypothetical protein ACRDD1_16925 [Planctomycetia bacterium]